jgi:hypothetical protein
MMATRSSATPAQWLYGLVAVTLAFKLWLSAVFPITGDEAYFIYWGAAPALGYYDHPPMVGWLLALLLKLSDAPWVLRLPITVLPAAMALALYLVLRGRGGAGASAAHAADADAADANSADANDRAALAAIGLLLVPVHVWNVFITTDTPLVLWSFLAGLAYWRAHSVGGSGDSGDVGARRAGGQGSGWFVAAGVFLGLAFLSKYFAALLGIAFLAVVLASPRGQRRWRGLLITCAAALPFVAVNLYWNWEHCWANLMFNLYNRHGDAGWSWRTPALYAATVLYTLSPVALVALAKDRSWLARLRGDTPLRVLVTLGGLPFLLFAVLSSFKQVGLHWVLSFVPFFFAACALLLSRRALKASVIFLGAFSAIHVAIILVASTQPLERWQGNRIYDGAVFHFRIHDVLAELKPYEGEFELAADGYSAAVTASFYRGRYVFVFGEASSHARHDDIATDFRKFAGRNIAVLRKSPPRDEDYRPYFDAVEYKSFDVAGAKFHIVLGRGFNYAAYRDRVLVKVRDRYYRMPGYLPQGHCDFCERYFEGASCPVR